MVQLSHPYTMTGKTIALTTWTSFPIYFPAYNLLTLKSQNPLPLSYQFSLNLSSFPQMVLKPSSLAFSLGLFFLWSPPMQHKTFNIKYICTAFLLLICLLPGFVFVFVFHRRSQKIEEGRGKFFSSTSDRWKYQIPVQKSQTLQPFSHCIRF